MYTAGYYPHNYDFLAFAASMIGRSRQSIDAVEKLPAIAPAEMLRAPGMTFLQHHRTRHLQMKVRFSRWHDILATPAPDEDLPHAVAMWNYARGRALAARGDTAQAKVAPRTPARSGGGSDTRRAAARVQYVGCNPRDRDRGADRAHCGIYERLRGGGRAPSRGGEARGCVDLRRATRLVVPVRQELGIVLLRAERPAEAEQAFREDLKRFPENGWSLLQRSVSCPDTDFSSLNKPDVEPRRGAQSATSPHGASRRSPVSIP
jgi:hypothetical protein